LYVEIPEFLIILKLTKKKFPEVILKKLGDLEEILVFK